MPSSGRAGPGRAARPGSRLVLLALLGVALGLWLLRGRLPLPDRQVGGEARVRQALGRQERARLEGPPGGLDLSVDLFPVRFADVSASFDGDRATVVAMVEAEGRAAFGGESAAVSYVGRERFHMRPCAAALCPEADQLARLRGVLELLVRRHRSLAGTEPGRRVLGWQIRVERATAEAGEDLEVKGADGSPARERARLSLRWAEGGWAILP